MRHSLVTIDAETGSSTLAISIGDGPVRILTYQGGRVFLDAVSTPITVSRDDFEWIVIESEKWVRLIEKRIDLPSLAPNIFSVEFVVGDKVGMSWNVTFRGTYENLTDDAIIIGFTTVVEAGMVKVQFEPRPAAAIAWVNFVLQNQLAREMLYTMHTGVRPVSDDELTYSITQSTTRVVGGVV